MNPLKAATIWLLICFGLAAIFAAGGLVGYDLCLWDMQTTQLAFEPVYPDSPPIKIVATQAELMRLGFYEGLNDGKCGKLTLAAELKYLCALIQGETFDTIWDGYVMPSK